MKLLPRRRGAPCSNNSLCARQEEVLPPRQRSAKVGRRRYHDGIIHPSARAARSSGTEDASVSGPSSTRQLAAAVVAFLGANNLMMTNAAHALEDVAVVEEAVETTPSLITTLDEVAVETTPTTLEGAIETAPSLPISVVEEEEEAAAPSVPTYNIRGTTVEGSVFGEKEGESANSFKQTGVYQPVQPQIPLSERKPTVGFSTSDWGKVGNSVKGVNFTSIGAASVALGAVAYGSTTLIRSLIQTGNEEDLRKKALERHEEFVKSQPTEGEEEQEMEEEEGEGVAATAMIGEGGALDGNKEDEATTTTTSTTTVSFLGTEYLMPKGADVGEISPEEQRAIEQFARSTAAEEDRLLAEELEAEKAGKSLLEEKAKAAEAKAEALTQDLAAVQQSFDKLKAESEEQLKAKEAKLEKTIAEASRMLQEVGELTERITEKEKEAVATQEEVHKMTRGKAEAEEKLHKLETSLETKEKELQSALWFKESLEKELVTTMEKEAEAVSQISESYEEAKAKLETLTTENEALVEKLEMTSSKLTEAEASCKEASSLLVELKESHEKEKKELHNQVSEKSARIEALESQVKKGESERASYGNTIAAAKKQAEAAEAKGKESQEKVLQLEEELKRKRPAVQLMPLAVLWKRVWSAVVRFFNDVIKALINNIKPRKPSLRS